MTDSEKINYLIAALAGLRDAFKLIAAQKSMPGSVTSLAVAEMAVVESTLLMVSVDD